MTVDQWKEAQVRLARQLAQQRRKIEYDLAQAEEQRQEEVDNVKQEMRRAEQERDFIAAQHEATQKANEELLLQGAKLRERLEEFRVSDHANPTPEPQR